MAVFSVKSFFQCSCISNQGCDPGEIFSSCASIFGTVLAILSIKELGYSKIIQKIVTKKLLIFANAMFLMIKQEH